jgi:ADP-ribose pyrophosphatase
MVDPGELVTTTLKREFMEEALSVDSSALVEDFFTSKGVEIFKGYIDDPRNTDNAWMESVAYNFHDETGDIVGNMKLNAGDDARNVKWIEINSSMKLYASHSNIVKEVAEKLGAHF